MPTIRRILTHIHPKKDDYAKAVDKTEKEILIYKVRISFMEKAKGSASKPTDDTDVSAIAGTKRGNG
jgi:hypothetical protein